MTDSTANRSAELSRYLTDLVLAAEDALVEAEADETAAVFSGTADPARLGTPARKRLREAINAVPADALNKPGEETP